ncbi:hypothetical protein M5K25_024909 [Dendrobium thyrsiflorum]|uniref:Uncharacterized protein n=1 Tax=Dendrobium thyrsiflorum TaxID=117978 RepID=A0ABD0U3B5_DENTH
MVTMGCRFGADGEGKRVDDVGVGILCGGVVSWEMNSDPGRSIQLLYDQRHATRSATTGSKRRKVGPFLEGQH